MVTIASQLSNIVMFISPQIFVISISKTTRLPCPKLNNYSFSKEHTNRMCNLLIYLLYLNLPN